MIEVKNLYKSFDGIPVLKDVSTQFEKGKTNLIIGRSGSGKTVLIKTILGLFDIDSGEIWYDDRNFTKTGQDTAWRTDATISTAISGVFNRAAPHPFLQMAATEQPKLRSTPKNPSASIRWAARAMLSGSDPKI